MRIKYLILLTFITKLGVNTLTAQFGILNIEAGWSVNTSITKDQVSIHNESFWIKDHLISNYSITINPIKRLSTSYSKFEAKFVYYDYPKGAGSKLSVYKLGLIGYRFCKYEYLTLNYHFKTQRKSKYIVSIGPIKRKMEELEFIGYAVPGNFWEPIWRENKTSNYSFITGLEYKVLVFKYLYAKTSISYFYFNKEPRHNLSMYVGLGVPLDIPSTYKDKIKSIFKRNKK